MKPRWRRWDCDAYVEVYRARCKMFFVMLKKAAFHKGFYDSQKNRAKKSRTGMSCGLLDKMIARRDALKAPSRAVIHNSLSGVAVFLNVL